MQLLHNGDSAHNRHSELVLFSKLSAACVLWRRFFQETHCVHCTCHSMQQTEMWSHFVFCVLCNSACTTKTNDGRVKTLITFLEQKAKRQSFLLFVIQYWMLKICESIHYYLIRDEQEAKLLNIWYVLICVYVIEYNGQCPQQNSVELWTPRGELLISQW